MIKKKYFFSTLAVSVILLGGTVLAQVQPTNKELLVQGSTNLKENLLNKPVEKTATIEINDTKNNKKVTITSSSKTEKFGKDFETAKSTMPIRVKVPDIKTYNMNLVSTSTTTNMSAGNEVKILQASYSLGDSKFITIRQGNPTGQPDSILNESKKISFAGKDIWVYDPVGDGKVMQILFWDNGLFYNLISKDISEKDLLGIATSLK